MGKLTEAQKRALADVHNHRPGYFTAWDLGTSTCEALRKKGLVEHRGGDRPFTVGWRNNECVYITEAGRAAARRALSDAKEQADG
ncbi:MAG TPA: hypothetical protein VNS34_10445 [Rhizobiaceae bacterium]|nr:hypothetical protein [Rhizobiaceae bacterium]